MPSYTRRRALALFGTGVGLAGCVSGDRPSGDLGSVDGGWPVEGFDPGRTRSVDDGPADPETVWTTELDARAAETPSIAGGRVYVPVDAVTDRARHRFRVHSLDASTGDERWRVPLRSQPNESPAIGSGRILVSARRAPKQGRLVAFEDRYGDEDWLYDVDARVTAPPMIDGTTVYLPDWQGYVHALSIADGAVRWARQISSDGTSRTFARPVAVDDGTLYLGSYSGRPGVVAVDAATGDELWARSTARVTAGPVVHDGLVVVKSGSVLRAFDTDGSDRWAFNVVDDHWEVPLAVDDQQIYVPTQDRLYAITRGGERAWEYEPAGRNVGPPTVVGDTVVVHTSEMLTALARADGTTRWRVETTGSGTIVTTPTTMFLRGSGGHVVALGEK